MSTCTCCEGSSSVQERLMLCALGEAGQKEVSGPEANPRVVEYLRAAHNLSSSDETPWCSAYLCWCAEQIGIESPQNAAARSWLRWGEEIPLRDAQVGDVVIFEQPGSTWKGHVGLFLRRAPEGVVLWGGNQSNAVGVKIERRPVLGVRRYRA